MLENTSAHAGRRERHWFDCRVGKVPWRKGRAPHSSALAWGTPWTEEPGGLQPEGRRVRHEGSDLVCVHAHKHLIHIFMYIFTFLLGAVYEGSVSLFQSFYVILFEVSILNSMYLKFEYVFM